MDRTASESEYRSPLQPLLPAKSGHKTQWGRLYGEADALTLAHAARQHAGLVLIVAPDSREVERLLSAIGLFLADTDIPALAFPDWETLPYDVFSPLPDIISQRLETLYRLPNLQRGVLVVPVATCLQRLPPRQHILAHSLVLEAGQTLDIDTFRRNLEAAGYRCVSQVMEHGEFAVRGSLFDLYPMGSRVPFRIDLFDDEVETIREFDPEDQRTRDKVANVRLLPAREFPFDANAIDRFRQAFRQTFPEAPQRSTVYQSVSDGNPPPGIEFYLPLFFDQTATLFDYLPADTLIARYEDFRPRAEAFRAEVEKRYEQRRYDQERPLLPPEQLYLSADRLEESVAPLRQVVLRSEEIPHAVEARGQCNYATRRPPDVALHARKTDPAENLRGFLKAFSGRVLFAAETAGRREHLLELLRGFQLKPRNVEDWAAFLSDERSPEISVAPFEQGLCLDQPPLAVITETQLYGERVRQRRRKAAGPDADQIIRNLTELSIGAPVVHEEQGVGRYLGLKTLDVGGVTAEFLTLEYAKGDKLYVPVSSLHLISRYTGTDPEHAPLHRLGGEQWARIKRKAAEKVSDIAAELLDVYARREARQGHAFLWSEQEYKDFAASFPFEETADQATAIEAVLGDMARQRPMDRVVCGDVGFGKTEVAMRAAYAAAAGGKQVAVLVPTTLLAQQHYQNFQDRFADWPIRVESLSRFGTKKAQDKTLAELAEGKVDIVIGTHKLLQPGVRFKDLGLVIVDEEHRFGVRHKEKFKSLRAEVDLLTLTATPIPRTLNMAMSGMRDLSIIATPPQERHAIKTFVSEWNAPLVQEAILREIKRGGQVYFLHNEVKTIEKTAKELEALVPEARVRVAHGQMRERELEEVMLDFYHRRFNILVCTTIVESGIDVPTANTILMNRADKLGLAQLHQLRGRVGRSHHRAYAYLIVPPKNTMTPDAIKRLEAIESLEDLGAGFTLATHDLEIRGAGELLGDEQSGQIQEIGFTLYMDLLERAVNALKSGKHPELERPLQQGTEVDLGIPALLPEDYVPDVHTRLVMYKRIASATDEEALNELQVEMIDRFGLLPGAAKNLIKVTEIKLRAQQLGIKKVEAGAAGGRLSFDTEPRIDSTKIVALIQKQPKTYTLDGGERLRFKLVMETPEQRIQAIYRLFDILKLPEAA